MKNRKCKENKRKRKRKQKGIVVARFSRTRYSYLSYSAFRQNALLLVWLKSRQPGLKISLSPFPPSLLPAPLSPNCSIAAVALPPSTTPPPPEAAFDHTAAARRLRPHRRRPRPSSSSPPPPSTTPPLPEPEPALAADRKAMPLLSLPSYFSLLGQLYICWYCVDVHMNPRCSYEP